jgi:hypothetical protein
MDPEIFEMMQKSEQEMQPKGIASFNNFYQSLKEPVVGNLGILDLYGMGRNFLNPTPFGMALTGIGALRSLAENLGPNYRGMMESDITNQGYTLDDIGRIVQTGAYATPQNIMAGYSFASPGYTGAAFDRIDKIRENIKKGIYKNPIEQQKKINALGQAVLDKERARKEAYNRAIEEAKNQQQLDRARTKSITEGYGGYDNSPGATGPTAAGAGMGYGGGYASDYGFKRGGIVSLYG